ncbi:hypothetical protein SEA_ANNADREAMY_101 [Streptomyces phage Annadreamy]|uniref:Uncharacterized protein n=3 Tax=Annadreamyvirus TaxID=2843347 RepID=A0A345GTD9_9CAUD|nr:hypothetical protein HWB75_gp152 [Streptomyces phage Annadreamy]YP_009839296.1 hypothetical protein HWB76_gp158 [Streptomyces phage Blueeyedbeauty]QGH79435.1 hypothetical protein SEA_LIMPID_110 [Streptomyces phage Limpid]QOI67500.1 hypothetical protein SEA_BEUFFERT_108 [Streptomyces phage Beuffert]AXG66211.1 hypothetical protein SEA_ANNADREAMY_101 [Streptomyces phage Annadreamy]AXH49244.1 hypothetical protein SEA_BLUEEYEDBEAUTY_111 [Streptomyces phage Blueeyedbeauty]
METHVFSVMLQVEVEAPSEDDAREAIRDCFGEGSNCGANVVEYEVLDHARLD